MNKKKISIGKILSAHGVKGQFKVMSFMENPEDLGLFAPLWIGDLELKKWTLFSKTGKADIFIASCDLIKTREDVDLFKGKLIEIERDLLPQDDGDIYYYDLEGKEVVDPKGNPLGHVIQVHNFGAGPLLEVKKENQNTFFSIHSVKELDQNPLVLTFCPSELA